MVSSQAGILIIEILGSFYLRRLFITTQKALYEVNMWFATILAVLLMSLYDLLQHRILHEWAKNITGNDSLDYRLYTHYIRMGIMRTTNLFAHPILYRNNVGPFLSLYCAISVL